MSKLKKHRAAVIKATGVPLKMMLAGDPARRKPGRRVVPCNGYAGGAPGEQERSRSRRPS